MEKDTLAKVVTVMNIVISGLVIYTTIKLIVGPDGFKTARMASVRYAARFAKQQGEWWTTAGNKLDSTYYKIAQP
jgi:hypothetical protein